MLTTFFKLAAVSPGRQAAFRRLVVMHPVLLSVVPPSALTIQQDGTLLLGHVVLIAGIVEGALVLGSRWTQMPKSQSLRIFACQSAEAADGYSPTMYRRPVSTGTAHVVGPADFGVARSRWHPLRAIYRRSGDAMDLGRRHRHDFGELGPMKFGESVAGPGGS